MYMLNEKSYKSMHVDSALIVCLILVMYNLNKQI
jgi:hypothetical protein